MRNPRTRWQGWTIVEKDGSLVLDITFRDPFIWTLKADAEKCKDEDQRVVRCEVMVIK